MPDSRDVLTLTGRPGHDPVARRRHRRLLARARPLLLPLAVVLSALLLGGRLLPAPDTRPWPAAAPPQPPAGRVLVVVTPADPAVLGLATPGAVVDVYGALDALAGPGLTGDGGARAGRLVEAAPVLAPGGTVSAAGPDPPALAPGPLVAGSPVTGSVVLAVTDDEARALAGQQGRGLSLAVRTASERRTGSPPPPGTDAAPPDGGARQPDRG